MPQFAPIDHDPFAAATPGAPDAVGAPADPAMTYAFADKAKVGGAVTLPIDVGKPASPSPNEAASQLYGMTGIPDIQQGAQAFQRGEYLPALGQAGWGAASLASMLFPVGRGAVSGIGAATRAGEAVGMAAGDASAAKTIGALGLPDEATFHKIMEGLGLPPAHAGPITAYHGSNADFDKFDLSKVGTGLGQTSLGKGLYFTGDENYAKNLHPGGHTYQANLALDPNRVLEWGKPMNQQTPEVRASLDAIYGKGTSERSEAMQHDMAPRTDAELKKWRESGLPAIRYGQNHVVFDDKLIDIVKKYGMAGLTAAGVSTVVGANDATAHVIPVEHDPFAAGAP